MILKDLSDKEIKTINGGNGCEFSITTFFVESILGTALNLIKLTKTAYNQAINLLLWN